MGINGKHFYRFTYLKSEEWHGAREIALVRHQARCSLCNKKDWSNDCHHWKYPKSIWRTQWWHLIVLCRKCHNDIHFLMRNCPDIKNWREIKERWKSQKNKESEHFKPRLKKTPRCNLCRKENVPLTSRSVKKANFLFCNNCWEEVEPILDSEGFWSSLNQLRKVHLSIPLVDKTHQ